MIRLLCALAAVLTLLTPVRARAGLRVIYPYAIDLGELEIEHNGTASFDRRPAIGGATTYTLEIATGLTAWWKSEIEFGFDRQPGFGQPTLLTQLVTENTFQLTEHGEFFADFGFYFEYGQSLGRGSAAGPNQITFGPVIAKDIGRTIETLNLFLTRELGPNQNTHGLDFTYIFQSRWNLWAPLSPAVEIYGNTGTLDNVPGLTHQQLLAGPVAVGTLFPRDFGLGRAGKLKYELGWLFGLTPVSPAGTLRWRLEVDIPF